MTILETIAAWSAGGGALGAVAGGVAHGLRHLARARELREQTEHEEAQTVREQLARQDARIDGLDRRIQDCEHRHDACREQLHEARARADEAILAAVRVRADHEALRARLAEGSLRPPPLPAEDAIVPAETRVRVHDDHEEDGG